MEISSTPWKNQEGYVRDIEDANGELIATTYPLNDQPDEVAENNARLIADAPLMLEALKEAYDMVQELPDLDDHYEKMVTNVWRKIEPIIGRHDLSRVLTN